MSPRNRLRLILLAEFLRSPRFMVPMLIAEILLTIWCLWNGFYIIALIAAVTAYLDGKAIRGWAVANRLSRRSR